MAVNEFRETLERLGLAQYHDGLVGEAFDSWEVLADITEEDMDALGVKLGHRRVLQRAIAEYRREGAKSTAVIDIVQDPATGRNSVDGSLMTEDKNSGVVVTSRATNGGKRKYRRHPKPDENAPDRPPSAYVLFSNQVRESLKGQEYSFTEIAKTVGERWQVLPPDEKATYESRSQALKDTYYAHLAEYKKTQDYADYQKYLAEFKAKHEGKDDNKRKREDSDNSQTRRPSDERDASSPDNRTDGTHSSGYPERKRSDISSPNGFTRLEWRPQHASYNGPPEDHQGNASPGFSPRHNRTTFSSINGPPPAHQSLPGAQQYSMPEQHNSSPRINEHPMASSTNLAYGFTPMMTQHSSTSNSPPLPNTRNEAPGFPPIMGNRPRGSPFGPMRSALPNRQLPPLFPSRQQTGSQGIPLPMKSPQMADGFQQQQPPTSSGIATLLRAGEHLASNDTRSPPLRGERSSDGGGGMQREDRPP